MRWRRRATCSAWRCGRSRSTTPTGSSSACCAPSCRRSRTGSPCRSICRSGKKGVDLTYTIRPDATWGDGVPVTTADVLFTYEVGRNPQSAVSNAELYRRITGIDVKDDKTFTLHVDKLTFDYARDQRFRCCCRRISSGRPSPTRRSTACRPAMPPTRPTPGSTTAPTASARSRPARMSARAEPALGRPPGPFRRITVRTIENTAALEANLLSGTIDMVAGELGLSLDEALAFEKRHGGAFQIIFKPGLVFEHIDLNLDRPVLADRRVRQALLLGLDREAISRSLFAGRQPVADSFVNPLDRGYSADDAALSPRPGAAAALLDEAGWHVAIGGGLRGNAAGQPLSLELMTTAGNRTRELVQQVLQSQWRKIGVDVRLKNEPARVLFGETMPHRRFDMAMYAWISAPENVPRSTLHSDEIPRGRQRLRRPEHARLQERRGGPADRRARNRARPRQAQDDVGRTAAPLRDRAARRCRSISASDTFILPKWLKASAHRKPVLFDAWGRNLARGVSGGLPVTRLRGRSRIGERREDPAELAIDTRLRPPLPYPAGGEGVRAPSRGMIRFLRGGWPRCCAAGVYVVRDLRADRADAGRSDRPDALGRPAHERRGRGPAQGPLRRRPAVCRPLSRLAGPGAAAASSAIRGCSPRRSGRRCCRGSAIRCC